ncbi:MAG: gamma-glutamyltransferase [Actinomycetota bacterium]|jgi:gamma-glutamyltranspeptidase/glutathione hydrolase|nr:gamma-glutamyltransferase [Actinomycetota bacterium]
MNGAIAAGHRQTAAAGARVLEEGGNAVDACVAAAFAAWVAESPLTGPGAGGFALVVPGDGRPARVADFFVATPGRGRPAPAGATMHAIDVGFGGDSETTQVFRIGEASCAVPGAAAGLEALHGSYGRLPWSELLQPAIELARTGVEMIRPQAHLHAILDLILRHSDEGRRLYSRPDSSRLLPGDVLRLPDLGGTLERIAEEGARPLYEGELARATVEAVAAGGLLTREDLAGYRVVWRRPVRVPYGGFDVISNPPPSSGGVLIAYGLALLERVGRGEPGSAEAISSLAGVMREQTRARAGDFAASLYRGGLARRLLSVEALAGAAARIEVETPGSAEHRPAGGTTHVSVVDADGNAASLSSSTGSGSGVIVAGTGIHLNNMLGEYDLVAGGPATPGRRLTSMMAPTVVRGEAGPRLVVGSAGSVRLRGAIMQVIDKVVGHGLGVAEAIDAPRVHVDEPHLHCEGGFDPRELDRLESWGYDIVRWRRRNLFFGGTNAVEVLPDGSLAAAGDARRGGDGVVVG